MTTQFKGIPLIDIPKNIPIYNILTGDFGKEIFDEFYSIVKQKYKNNENLKVLKFDKGIVKCSNIYSLFPMNEVLSKYRLRTVNLADIQKIINKNKSFLWSYYVDLGLILKTENPPNKYLAKQLGEQAKKRGYNFSNESPLVFATSDLELILDKNSSSGLGFKIKESASLFKVEELKKEMPIFKDIEENRKYFIEKEGLLELFLDWVSNLNYTGYLGASNDDCRIVVLKDGT